MAVQRKNKIVEKTRRKSGQGSIYLDSTGKWVGAIRITQDNGVAIRKKVYGHSQEEVSKKLLEISGRMNMLKNSDIAEKTFNDLFDDWILIFKQPSVSPRTFEGNFRNYTKHIKPRTKNYRLDQVTPAVVQTIINDCLMNGMAIATTKKIKFLFNQFFEYAEDNGWVLNNPVRKVKIRNRNVSYTDSENSYKAIQPEERLKFVTALNQYPLLKGVCLTAMLGGLRIGEILALRWENVDFENKTLQVTNSITQVPTFDKKGKVTSRKTVIGSTKTNCSVREIPIPDMLVETFKEWKKEQWIKEQIYKTSLITPNSIIFSNIDGTVRTYSGTKNIFYKFIKRNNLSSKIHFHTLRHTYSNMLFESNENPKIIQALLGHKSVKTTLTVYNSVDKSYYRNATDKLNSMFNESEIAKFNEQKKQKESNHVEIKQNELTEEDAEILLLEQILAERRARKLKEQDEEM